MHITNRDDVFAANASEMFLRAMAGGDECDVQLIARRIGSEEFKLRQQKRRSTDDCSRGKKLASFHE